MRRATIGVHEQLRQAINLVSFSLFVLDVPYFVAPEDRLATRRRQV